MKTELCICFLLSIFQGCSGNFTISVSTGGTYSLLVNGDVWLKSAPTFFRANRQLCTTANGTLKLTETTGTSGSDFMGRWQATNFIYEGATRPFQASIYLYNPESSDPNDQFIIFKQKYLGQVNATQGPTTDDVIAGFPGFLVQDGSVPLGYLAYGGSQYGDEDKKIGQFGPDFDIASGIASGPLAIFDREKQGNALIFSSANHFMAQNLWHDNHGNENNIYWGLMGGISDVWPDFEVKTILFYSDKGINKGFEGWGRVLQKMYRRDERFVKSDFTINYLGYWTDNGAFYYYETEHHKNYQDTIVDVANYIKQTGIPFRYIQYDSWWYYKGPKGGVVTWDSTPDVFPDGLQWVYNKTGLPVSAHNRYWSNQTTYARQNGGKYSFIIEGSKALPIDQDFWNDLLADAKEWGLITYEQDWLNNEFTGLPSLTFDPLLGEQWLDQMGEGAARSGLTIQYCMAFTRHVLQGIGIPAVTQARASKDYHPGRDQWRIGISSMLAWGTGIVPFKDNFWTTTVQDGKKYKGDTEPNTELNALVATVSTGPVGPSDMIGKLNKTIIMRSINADGLILKPSKPATAIDNMIRKLAWSDFEGPDGEVWSTYSVVGGDHHHGIILAADTHGTYNLTPSDAGFESFATSMVYSAKNPNKVQQFTDQQPLQISQCTMIDYCLYYVNPVIHFQGKNILIQGELSKWVPMSPQRIVDINVDQQDIDIRLKGAAGELVVFWFNIDGESKSIPCKMGEDGFGVVSVGLWSCIPE